GVQYPLFRGGRAIDLDGVWHHELAVPPDRERERGWLQHHDRGPLLELARDARREEMSEGLDRGTEAHGAREEDAMRRGHLWGDGDAEKFPRRAAGYGAREREGDLHCILQPLFIEAPDAERPFVPSRRPHAPVARAGDVVPTGADAPRNSSSVPADFQHAPEHLPDIAGRRSGAFLGGVRRRLPLLLARELDEILQEPEADVMEGRQPSKATRRGSEVHADAAAGGQITSVPLPRGTQTAYYHDRRPIGQPKKVSKQSVLGDRRPASRPSGQRALRVCDADLTHATSAAPGQRRGSSCTRMSAPDPAGAPFPPRSTRSPRASPAAAARGTGDRKKHTSE